MILVDTSVWIDHLRRSNSSLTELLNGGQVLAHPFVIGEIALENLKQRNVVLARKIHQWNIFLIYRIFLSGNRIILGFIFKFRL